MVTRGVIFVHFLLNSCVWENVMAIREYNRLEGDASKGLELCACVCGGGGHAQFYGKNLFTNNVIGWAGGGEVVVDEAFPSSVVVGEERFLEYSGEFCCVC